MDTTRPTLRPAAAHRHRRAWQVFSFSWALACGAPVQEVPVDALDQGKDSFALTAGYCGDIITQPELGETCDDGARDTSHCDRDCTIAHCGDSYHNAAAGEQCDTGWRANTATCDTDCTLSVCGDRFVNQAAGEQCDEGSQSTTTCNANCRRPACGDGFVNAATEQCDDYGRGTFWCDPDCSLPVCGDRHLNLEAGELCDSGGPDCETCGYSIYVYASAMWTRQDSTYATILFWRSVGADSCTGWVDRQGFPREIVPISGAAGQYVTTQITETRTYGIVCTKRSTQEQRTATVTITRAESESFDPPRVKVFAVPSTTGQRTLYWMSSNVLAAQCSLFSDRDSSIGPWFPASVVQPMFGAIAADGGYAAANQSSNNVTGRVVAAPLDGVTQYAVRCQGVGRFLNRHAVRQAAVEPSLAAYYPFSEGIGNTTGDASYSWKPGTLRNTSWTTGASGNGLAFNNASSVEIPLNNNEQLTVSAWFYRTAKDTTAGTADSLVSAFRWNSDPALREGYELRFQAVKPDLLQFFAATKDPATGVTFNGVATVALAPDHLNKWFHVVGTYDRASGRQVLFVNGVASSTILHPAGNIIKSLSNRREMTIGYGRANDAYFSGIIDEVRIYNRPWTATEVSAEFCRAGTTAICSTRGAECGSLPNVCGQTMNCGNCSGTGEICGALTPNVCNCVPESDSTFCARQEKSCESFAGTDNCGNPRTVNCGVCSETCFQNQCYFRGAICPPGYSPTGYTSTAPNTCVGWSFNCSTTRCTTSSHSRSSARIEECGFLTTDDQHGQPLGWYCYPHICYATVSEIGCKAN